MPKDVPDWTGLNQVNLIGGVSGDVLGDVGAVSPVPDQATATVNASPGPINGSVAVLLSLKAAAGQVIALRGVAGALTVGTSQAVTPAYGQAPAAGNCLACLVSHGGNTPGTVSPGWAKQADSLSQAAGEVDIFLKPNSAGGDAAPTITCNNPGGTPMVAVLVELTGVATVNPQENTGSITGAAASITPVATAADAAFGDAVLLVARWTLGAVGTVSFSEVFNQSAPAVHLGGTETDSVAPRAHDFALAIIPGSPLPQPVGVASWGYDVQATAAPAVGTPATITLAASATKVYTCARIGASLLSTTAASHIPSASLTDGANTPWFAIMGVQAVVGSSQAIDTAGLAHEGTINTPMVLTFSGNAAGGQQGLTIGAYLR